MDYEAAVLEFLDALWDATPEELIATGATTAEVLAGMDDLSAAIRESVTH